MSDDYARFSTPRKYLGGRPDDPVDPKVMPTLLEVAALEERMRRSMLVGEERMLEIRETLGVSVFTYGVLLNRVRRDPECQANYVRLVAVLNSEAEYRASRRAPLEELRP